MCSPNRREHAPRAVAPATAGPRLRLIRQRRPTRWGAVTLNEALLRVPLTPAALDSLLAARARDVLVPGPERLPAAAVAALEARGITVWVRADPDLGRLGTRQADGARWRRCRAAGLTTRQRALKRALDLLLTVALLPLIGPLTLLTVLIVLLTEGRPIFYSQTRVGRGGRPFKIYKFRTMAQGSENQTPLLARPGDPRITPVGRHLKNLHLDELPQFWNVIRGDMTLVGPRPERPIFTQDFERRLPAYRERHVLGVGLTGLAQLRGDYSTPVEIKLVHDLRYVAQWSPWVDLRLLVATGWMLARKLLRLPARQTTAALPVTAAAEILSREADPHPGLGDRLAAADEAA